MRIPETLKACSQGKKFNRILLFPLLIYALLLSISLFSVRVVHATDADDWDIVLFGVPPWDPLGPSPFGIWGSAVCSNSSSGLGDPLLPFPCSTNASDFAEFAYACTARSFGFVGSSTDVFRADVGLDSASCLIPKVTNINQLPSVTLVPRCCLTRGAHPLPDPNSCYLACNLLGVRYSSVPQFPPTSSPKNLGSPSCPTAMCGNPINAATGNKFQAETDFIGAPQTQLELMRSYNSQDATVTAFGANWRGSYHRGLVQPDGTTAKVTRADGRVDTFKLNSGVWQADPDVTSRLIAMTNGWQLVLDDDTTEQYLSDGRLSTITTRAGLVTTLSYDTSTRLSTVTGPFGHRLTFTYDTASHVSQVTIPDGRVYRYAYDAQNNLVSVTYPDNAVRQYLYENASFPHALTGIIDENGNRFATYAYDAQGRATSTQHAGSAELTTVTYNSDGSAAVRDARNNTYGYDFTLQFDVVKPTAVSGAPVQTAGGKAFEYDILEFYQMSGQSGQRSEMVGGCLNHPIHPRRWPDSQYTWRQVRSIA